MTTAYPLAWPDGWPRTPPHQRMAGNQFTEQRWIASNTPGVSGYKRAQPISFDKARTKLATEMERLGARNVVLSTSLPLRLDGNPYASSAGRRMDDPGVALYFQYKKRPRVMACDRYTDIAANVRSLGMAIEAIRQLERHSGTMMERAFSGFAALPPPMTPQRPWRQVLQIEGDATPDSIDARFHALAMKAHPDTGGSTDRMAELNAARAEALREIA